MTSCMGYTNASWTLNADLTAQSIAKLLQYMDASGYTGAYDFLRDALDRRFAPIEESMMLGDSRHCETTAQVL